MGGAVTLPFSIPEVRDDALALLALAEKSKDDPPPFLRPVVDEVLKGLTRTVKAGDMDEAGVYYMSNQEKATDCRHLRGSILVTISRLRHRGNEVGTSAFAVGANQAATTIFGGSTKGLDREAEYRRDRARIEAYNRHLAAKGCPTVDIAAELARPPD